ncbi:hypothetical protein ACPOLB_14215 [Rubrivivax sp. RP6-9]|uniref:hypothetical protein n=1 Tax=Rubrivivax sp. RP6-9 TaxID=3415750 RepID=UPI003CC60129
MTTQTLHPAGRAAAVVPAPMLLAALRADAAVSAAAALLQLLAGPALATATGLAPALLLASGVFMVGYVALLLWAGTRTRLARGLARLFVVGNLGWAAGCVLLAAFGPAQTTAAGQAYLLLQALGVATLALWQRAGLRRSAAAQ